MSSDSELSQLSFSIFVLKKKSIRCHQLLALIQPLLPHHPQLSVVTEFKKRRGQKKIVEAQKRITRIHRIKSMTEDKIQFLATLN